MPRHGLLQLVLFALALVAIGAFTWSRTRRMRHSGDEGRDYFLAGGGLTWIYVAGAITITNLGTEQLVGMNGNQMLLLAWWELAGFVGLLILAYVFLPIYYRYGCTTTTELLERRYNDRRIRTLISVLFLFGYIFISAPSALYTGALFVRTVFGVDAPLLAVALFIAILGCLYGLAGGLRAIAVSETVSGASLLIICLVIVIAGMAAIGWSFDGIPRERLTLIGGPDSPIPWPTLFTGMIFIQIFYWSTNQAITQKAMASPSLGEAQRGVLAAAAIRLLIVPVVVTVPGIVAYRLFGELHDAAFGRLVGEVLPPWLSGIFAAVLVTSVATHFMAVLNSAAALYVCDLHLKHVNPDASVGRVSLVVSVVLIAAAMAMVPVYAGAVSIINLVQQLNGLLSMPILSAFVVGLLFKGVDARAAIAGVIFGVALYAFFTFVHAPFGLHYIHLMFVTLVVTVAFALTVSRLMSSPRSRPSIR